MTAAPTVSVVMGVHNGGSSLRETLGSVLSQSGVSFEFIVVDDGSTDNTLTELQGAAGRDDRLRVLHQPNAGLTRALVHGCSEVHSAYIARIDCGDIFLPGRLRRQVAILEENRKTVLTSCATRFVTSRGEWLYDVVMDGTPAETSRMLQADTVSQLRGVTHHGSVMFRTAAYRQCGGYRTAFYYAQDMDLWVRLNELGDVTFLPEILYEARVATTNISQLHAAEQQALGKLIIDARRCRTAGRSEEAVLEQAMTIRPGPHTSRAQSAGGAYFIGSVLRSNNDPACTDYFREALAANPFCLRAWYSLLMARLSRPGGHR